MVSVGQSIGYDGSKVLMLDDWMFAEHFRLVHLDHALNIHLFTAVTFYQEAAPLILFSTGEDYAKGTPFLTSIMNFMQFMYIYSPAYLSISAASIKFNIPC